MLDIIEHLKRPEEFMDELRFATGCKRPEVIITTANIGFFATRLMLFFGQFNYGKKGILDATHTRLFTFRSLRELLRAIRLQDSRSARDSRALSQGARNQFHQPAPGLG